MLAVTSCGQELTQGNSTPYLVNVGPITAGRDTLSKTQALTPTANIAFTIADFRHDDANIEVSICTSQKCYIAVSTYQGSGAYRVPTVGRLPNTYSATHQFNWQIDCGLYDPISNQYVTLDTTTPFWASIRVTDSTLPPIISSIYTFDLLHIKPTRTNCH